MTFYLGQTYDLIGDLENALATYQERINMGGWLQEVFEAHLRRVSPGISTQTAQARLHELIGSLEMLWPHCSMTSTQPGLVY